MARRAADLVNNGKTYKATLKGAPSVQFEILIRYASTNNWSADVTINPSKEAKQLGGFNLEHYDFEEIVPPVVVPTGNYAVVGRKDGSRHYAHYTLHNNTWWRVFVGSTEIVSAAKVQETLEDRDRWAVLYEGLPESTEPAW